VLIERRKFQSTIEPSTRDDPPSVGKVGASLRSVDHGCICSSASAFEPHPAHHLSQRHRLLGWSSAFFIYRNSAQD